MSVRYAPAVVPIAYPALYDLCQGRLPPSFEEWRIEEDAVRRALVAGGDHVIGICVVPADLARYCRATNCEADAQSLAAFAGEVGARLYERYDAERARTVVLDDNPAQREAFEQRVAERGVATDVTLHRPWWAFWRRPFSSGWFRSRRVRAIPT